MQIKARYNFRRELINDPKTYVSESENAQVLQNLLKQIAQKEEDVVSTIKNN